MNNNKGYEYALKVINGEIPAPKYVIKQCELFKDISDGKSDKYIIHEKKVKQIENILKLLIMPKGLKAGKTLYECNTGYQWLFDIAVLCTVNRDNPKKRRYETAILEVARKNFKALSLDTPIPTPNGWRTMGEITVGDYIFSPNGKPTRVTGESEIFNKPMYMVEFEDGEKIKASSDHIWTIKTKTSVSTYNRKSKHIGQGKKYRDSGWYDTTTKEMANDFRYLRKDGKGYEYKYRVPMNKAVEYPKKELEIDPYLLGVWLGNGTKSNTEITVNGSDVEELTKNLSSCGYDICFRKNKNRAPQIKIDKIKTICKKANGDNFLGKLRKLNLLNNKHIPRKYLEASVDQRMELLKGLMDTDGTCSERGQCSFIQKSKILSEQVLELINSLGFKATMIKRKAILNGEEKGDVYFISFFTDINNPCFKLERKKSRLKKQLHSRMEAKSIVNIKPIEAEPSKCIMVDDPSHLYLAGKHFTATHNTYEISKLFILLFLLEPSYSKFYSVAPDGALSREVREAICETIRSSPLIYEFRGNKRFKLLRDYVSFIPTQSKYIPLNYSTSRMDGRLPSVFVADEVGALPNNYPIEAMRSGQLNILNKLGFIISTKYPTIENPFEDEIKYAKRVLDGLEKDETVFALLYEPDDPTNWATDDLVLKQSNPVALEIPEIWEDLIKKRAKAIAVESSRENFLTKHCNIIYQGIGTETYVDVNDVKKCKVNKIDWTGKVVYLGVDLSMTNDNCAVAIASEEDGKILADVIAFIPEGRIEEKNRFEKINYYQFIHEMKCIACGNKTVDYKVIEDFVFSIEEKYGVQIQAIGFDRYNALSSAQKWDAKYNTVEIKQHSCILHSPTKLLYEKIVNGDFEYENNKLLEINFSNAKCTFDTNMNRYVTKKKSSGKVDMVVALINAVYLLQQDVFLNEDTFTIQVL